MKEKEIIRYIAGSATPEERERMLEWMAMSKENRQTFNRLKNLWVLNNLPITRASEKEVQLFSAKLRGKIGRKRLVVWSAVASLFLLLSVMLYHTVDGYRSQIEFLSQQQASVLEYTTNNGVKGRVVLPDGSSVCLNSGSRLRCPGHFTGDTRELEFSGEGFFDVVKNPKNPMVIHLNKEVSVVVKGTQFNLSSYKDDKDISALLLSGEITIIKTRHQQKEEIHIKPNEKVVISHNNRLVDLTKPKEFTPIIGWKEGWLIFDETPMNEVLKKLERWHGIHFDVRNPEILNQRFTARFKEESISQILEMMNNVALLSYELHDTTATLRKY